MNYKKLLYTAGAMALVGTLGLISRPGALLAQAVKSTLVRSVDEPGREPYMETKSYTPGTSPCPAATLPNGPLGGTDESCVLFFSTVPAGKRLIIQNISSRISAATPGTSGFYVDANLAVNATIGASGPQASVFFLQPHTLVSSIPTAFAISNAAASILQSHTMIQAYADPGTTPIFNLQNLVNANGTGSSYVTLSGYYVDLP